MGYKITYMATAMMELLNMFTISKWLTKSDNQLVSPLHNGLNKWRFQEECR